MALDTLMSELVYRVLSSIVRVLGRVGQGLQTVCSQLDNMVSKHVLEPLNTRLAVLEAKHIARIVLGRPRGLVEAEYTDPDTLQEVFKEIGFSEAGWEDIGLGYELQLVSLEHCRRVVIVWEVKAAPRLIVSWDKCVQD